MEIILYTLVFILVAVLIAYIINIIKFLKLYPKIKHQSYAGSALLIQLACFVCVIFMLSVMIVAYNFS